jgi:hypothetical protein
MSSDQSENEKTIIGMELKYCERCGGLWVREPGAGAYCGRCQGAIEELPAAKRKPTRSMLPVHRSTAIEDYVVRMDADDRKSFKAAGGLS